MNDDVQLRIIARGKHFLEEGYLRLGQVFWAKPKNAEAYIRMNLAEYAAGPSEGKPSGPQEKKLSETGPDSQSTDMQKSSPNGQVSQSSALVEAQALPQDNAPQPKKRGRPKKSVVSQ